MMTTERWLRLIAGVVVMGSVALGTWVDARWFGLTAFAGLNLFQSAFTDWCPAKWILERLGTKSAPQISRKGDVGPQTL